MDRGHNDLSSGNFVDHILIERLSIKVSKLVPAVNLTGKRGEAGGIMQKHTLIRRG